MLDRQALDSVDALPIIKQTTINNYYFHTVCATYEGTTLIYLHQPESRV